jgi:hypothetical protein
MAKWALERIEAELATPIDLVLSVGDFGLFLQESCSFGRRA